MNTELLKSDVDNPNAETWVSPAKHFLEINGFGYVGQNQGLIMKESFFNYLSTEYVISILPL